MAPCLTGSAEQGLLVGVALTGWTGVVIGVVAARRRGRRRGEGSPASHPDRVAATHSKLESPGLGALLREGASLIARLVGLAGICALAPAAVAATLTGNGLTAIAVGIVAFPVVLAQGLVAIKVDQ
jgi:hypothetical protein